MRAGQIHFDIEGFQGLECAFASVPPGARKIGLSKSLVSFDIDVYSLHNERPRRRF